MRPCRNTLTASLLGSRLVGVELGSVEDRALGSSLLDVCLLKCARPGTSPPLFRGSELALADEGVYLLTGVFTSGPNKELASNAAGSLLLGVDPTFSFGSLPLLGPFLFPCGFPGFDGDLLLASLTLEASSSFAFSSPES